MTDEYLGYKKDMHACTQVLLAGKRERIQIGRQIYMASPDQSCDTPLRRNPGSSSVICFTKPNIYIQDYFS